MAVDMHALLSKPANSVERPKPLPSGSYVFGVKSFKFDKTPGKDGKEPTPFVEFTTVPMVALPDVDEADLTASGGFKTSAGTPKELRKTFYITEDALFRLTEFLSSHLGLDASLPIQEQIQASPGTQFMGMVTHAQIKDAVYANIGTTAAVQQ